MKIIEDNNLQLAAEINRILFDFENARFLKISPIENKDEVGVLLSIPSVLNQEASPYNMKITRRYKECDLAYSEVLASINKDLGELLFVLKQEYLKLVRISKTFKPKQEDNSDISVVHIRLYLN